MTKSELPYSILTALSRARIGILTIALVHLASIAVGIAMIHTGSQFALDFSDGLVARAHAEDPASVALQRGESLNAAAWDFGRNLALGALPNTVGGLSIVLPYATAAYRGWVGGIVSVDGAHRSRLAIPDQSAYYILVVIIQLIPYTLAACAGVTLGWAYLRPEPYYQGEKWRGIPKEAIRDVVRIYLLIVPLFLLASLVEFLAV